MKARKGFTLIELMIMAVIISILTAIIIPQYQDYVARSEGVSALAMINPLKTTAEEPLSCGIVGSKTKTGITASTATGTYAGVAPDANRLGVIAVTIEDNDAGDISFIFQTGTSSPRNVTKAITLSCIADGVWTCKSTQDEMFIPRGCTKQGWIFVSGGV